MNTTIERTLPASLPDKPAELDEVGRVMMRAAGNLRERGWLQSDWGHAGERQCVGGHVRTAIEELGFDTPLYLDVFDRLMASLGSPRGDRLDWNNAPDRTAEEVAEALERAAYGV